MVPEYLETHRSLAAASGKLSAKGYCLVQWVVGLGMGSPFQAARISILVVTEEQGRACKQGVRVTHSYEQYLYEYLLPVRGLVWRTE